MKKATGTCPSEIEKRLCCHDDTGLMGIDFSDKGVSAVLFLLSENPDGELSLVLTKRSRLVSQPGDLCSPGGSVSPVRDRLISSLLLLPGMPLSSWQKLRLIRRRNHEAAASAAMLASAAMRETWEETGLNPFRVQLLGTMEPHRLMVFNKTIFPVCAWSRNTRSLKPNREVESIHWLPLSRLLDPGNYAAYCIRSSHTLTGDMPLKRETICYLHEECAHEEILWGATLGVTLSFLKTVYDFTPPARETLPLVESEFSENYFKDSKNRILH